MSLRNQAVQAKRKELKAIVSKVIIFHRKIKNIERFFLHLGGQTITDDISSSEYPLQCRILGTFSAVKGIISLQSKDKNRSF